DNTLNELESYYEYYIDLTPDAISPEKVGQNYIADVRAVNVNDADYGDHQTVHWYQFKIPVADGKPVNGIEDFKSIRFLRMLFTGFDTTVICRFAKFDLVRSEWRKYSYSLLETQEGLAQPETGMGSVDISAVSIEENSDRSPVNYLLPPGISRIVDNTTNQQVQRNEQAMMLTINNLADGDARATYKNATLDMRQFRRLIMDVHAEAINESRLRDNDLSLFVRIGNDYRYNYYEYEIPLKLTPYGRYADNQRELVWPVENKLDIPLNIFTDLKLERNVRLRTASGMTLTSVYEKADGKNTVRVVGNPNLGEVHVLMIGVKNPVHKGLLSDDDGLPKDGIVWVNEMRFTNFNEEGGWAANMRIAANLADFANVSLAGSMSRAGFGSLDSRILTRSQEDAYQYDLATNVELGKFFPTKWGVTLPLSFAFAESYIVPLYNPFDPDVKLQNALDRATPDEREKLQNTAIDYTMRRNFSLNNVRVAGSGKKPFGPADISNLTVGYAFSEELSRDVNTERDYRKEQRVMGAYAYAVKPYVFEPLAKNAALKGNSWKIIRDFNLALYPNQYGFATDLTDTYTEYVARSFYEGLKITPITFHEQVNNRTYTLGWDITRALKFTFSANNFSRREISTGNESDTIPVDNSWRTKRYNHEFSLAYTLPLSKLPILAWTNVTTSYRATYAWEAPQVANIAGMPYVGNTVRNSNNFQLNGAFNFVTLYNKSDLLKSINQEMDGRSAKKKETKDVTFEKSRVNLLAGSRHTVKHNLKDATGIKVQVFDEEGKPVKVDMETVDNRTLTIRSATAQRNLRVVVTGKAPVTDNPLVYLGKLAARTMMMLRNVTLVYAHGGETMLPGYTPKTTLLGQDERYQFSAPGWDFVAGSQSKDFWGNFYGSSTEYMLTRAYSNSWIIGDTTFINPFTMNAVTNLSMQATLEPFRDLRIDLTAKQSHANNRTWYDINNRGSAVPTETGSFSISTISIFTAFENLNSEEHYSSRAYSRFSRSRMAVADELARKRYGGAAFPRVDSLGGFPDGFSGLSQDVLIPSFEVGYLNKSVGGKTIRYTDFLSKIPLPNWTITYSGLSRIAALKPFIKAATLSHAYASTYGINAFATNSSYEKARRGEGDDRDVRGDFFSPYSIATVSLDERITLGSLDVAWQIGIQTRVELRKNRRVDLSMTNNQIIENSSWEGAAGAGYTFGKAPQLFRFSESQSATTTLTLRADFTYRDGKNLIRKLAEDTHQITDGRRNMAVKLTGDYDLLKDLTFRLFFDWTENNPYVSAVNTENISFGFSLRYVLGM
ncbi:MAG: cell surface protein SprA, partial [Prevotellaceae bacterium]|nr:cell surface protein SprA [Prevotellaceae bacterium]